MLVIKHIESWWSQVLSLTVIFTCVFLYCCLIISYFILIFLILLFFEFVLFQFVVGCCRQTSRLIKTEKTFWVLFDETSGIHVGVDF